MTAIDALRDQGRGIGSAALAGMTRWISRYWPESPLLKRTMSLRR
jgi:hypothetical protein